LPAASDGALAARPGGIRSGTAAALACERLGVHRADLGPVRNAALSFVAGLGDRSRSAVHSAAGDPRLCRHEIRGAKLARVQPGYGLGGDSDRATLERARFTRAA